MTVIVLPFHRVGYCNSTAPIEAKPCAKNFKLYSSPPCTFFLSGCEEPSLITQCYALRNVWFSPHGIVFRAKTIVLSSSKEKKETCSYPRTAQHHATCHCPFASSSSSHIILHPRISHPLFLVSFASVRQSFAFRLPNLHPYDRASTSRYSIILMKIIASHDERSEMKYSRSHIGKYMLRLYHVSVCTGQSRERMVAISFVN